MIKKLTLTGVVLVPMFALAVVVGPGIASAKTLSGNNVCKVSSGAISFSPPLTTSGSGQFESPTVSLALGSCSDRGAKRGTFTGSESSVGAPFTNNACSDLGATDIATEGTIWWKPSSDSVTGVNFPSQSESTGPPVEFHFGDGTTGEGSFSGTAMATLEVTFTQSQIAKACASPSGLGQLIIKKGGTFEVGPKY